MAFSETLAARIRDDLARRNGIEEKKMFGSVGFMLNGNLVVGVWKNSLIAVSARKHTKMHCWHRTSGSSTLPAGR